MEGAEQGAGPFTIGVLSRRSGCSADTIRYYERLGLIPQVRRTAGGHRLYDGRHVKRLGFIRRSRELALPLAQIRNILQHLDKDGYDCAEANALLVRQLAEARRRIKELQELEVSLTGMIEACGGARHANCAVIDAMLTDAETVVDVRCCD